MILDLLIKSGTVIDPSSKSQEKQDVGVRDGKIVGLFKPGEIDSGASVKEIVDATGCFVTPGLIDIHTHVFEGETELGINADAVGIHQGVTTVVDAGSSGVDTFKDFLSKVVEINSTQVLAWINIARDGLHSGLSELGNLENLAPKETADLIRQNEIIRGIKVRMSGSVVKESGIKPLHIAKEAAREARVPVLVHVGNAPPLLGDILDNLEKNDVVTHAFHGKPGGILDAQGRLIPQAWAALERGVLFDVGHGTSSFSFKTMMRAKELNVLPYSISTDIYQKNFNGPVYSLTMTMSKILALGFTLEQVIEATTWSPAKLLGLQDRIGTLRVGTTADITILRLYDEIMEFTDSEGMILQGRKMLTTQNTIKSGRKVKQL